MPKNSEMMKSYPLRDEKIRKFIFSKIILLGSEMSVMLILDEDTNDLIGEKREYQSKFSLLKQFENSHNRGKGHHFLSTPKALTQVTKGLARRILKLAHSHSTLLSHLNFNFRHFDRNEIKLALQLSM